MIQVYESNRKCRSDDRDIRVDAVDSPMKSVEKILGCKTRKRFLFLLLDFTANFILIMRSLNFKMLKTENFLTYPLTKKTAYADRNLIKNTRKAWLVSGAPFLESPETKFIMKKKYMSTAKRQNETWAFIEPDCQLLVLKMDFPPMWSTLVKPFITLRGSIINYIVRNWGWWNHIGG